MRTRIAATMATLTLLMIVADIVLTAQYRPLLSEAAVAVHGFPFVDLATLGSAVLGAAIISRDDRHVIGWLLCGVGAVGAFSLVTEAYAVWVVDEHGPGPMAWGSLSGWVSTLFGGQLAIAMIALMFLLAPDGRPLSPRWRYAVVLPVLGVLVYSAGQLSADPLSFDLTGHEEKVPTARGVLYSLGFLLIALGVLVALASMLVRLRRSRGVQRQQVRLIAMAAACLALGIAALIVIELGSGRGQTWLSSLPLLVAYVLLPVLFAVAVLRHRLYDVEVVINRTVVVVIGTVFAGVGYVSLVVFVGKLADRRTSGFWVSLVITALVALAFQPLRRTVVRLANRLAFGARAKPYEALWDFSRRLVEAPAPETFLSGVAEAAGRAVSARGATVTLDLPGAAAVTALWGVAAGDRSHTDGVNVREGGVVLGRIDVHLPKGRPDRPADVRLLQALADQAAVAFRNAAIESQLTRHVAALDETTAELSRSRARIIAADDAVRSTLSTAISREVLPHLSAVTEELHHPPTAESGEFPAAVVEELATGISSALASLRELTRGVFPTQLARSGLEAALRSSLRTRGGAHTLEVEPTAAGRRFSPRIEAAVYFCFTSSTGPESAPTSTVLAAQDDRLVLTISGRTYDDLDLSGITDRVEAVGGSIIAEDELTLSIPLDVHQPVAV